MLFRSSDAQLLGLFVTTNDFPLSIFSLLGIFMALSPHFSSPACEETSLSVRGTSECILGPGLLWKLPRGKWGGGLPSVLEHDVVDTFSLSGFQPPELREKEYVSLSHPICVTSL